MESKQHVSVLLNETIQNLNIKGDGIYLDGTLGLGGHSLEIVKKLTTGKLICIDKDDFAIENAEKRLHDYKDRILFEKSDFRYAADIIDRLGFDSIDGMIFDLGVSSPQLDNAERGFSYMSDAPLDMRMDASAAISAYDIVNGYSPEELSKILFEYGEERFARRIASAIAARRQVSPIATTFELVDVIRSAMPAQALREKQHPAKRSFQAIRIAVNDELGAVSEMMDTAPDKLKVGGRLCVISFHSLEDRIIKNKIHSREDGCTCPREAPVCVCGFKQTLKSVSKKPIIPSAEELEDNPRSRSAKLRVAERV